VLSVEGGHFLEIACPRQHAHLCRFAAHQGCVGLCSATMAELCWISWASGTRIVLSLAMLCFRIWPYRPYRPIS
jgi:hypothetical protein